MKSDYFELDTWKSIKSDSGNWYKVIERLGVGGNAVTFLALSTSKPRKGGLFAIKIFRKLSKPERRDSFLDEARYLMSCNHTSVMKIFDEGVYCDLYPFIVVEYLPKTLKEAMGENLGLLEKVTFGFQLLSAIDYLSSQNPPVLHRDIKPENIFIKAASCVLGDFGLIKRLDEKSGEDAKLVKQSIGNGMPYCYRSPDLVKYLRGEGGLYPNTDVFQLGLVMAFMFTGRNPCKMASDFESDVELNPIGRISSRFGSRILRILNRMLEFDPRSRPSAGELIDSWEKLFKDVVDASHRIEDKTFRF